MLVHPLVLAALAVKGAFLEAAQLEREARTQLLEPRCHRCLPLALALLKNVPMVPE